MSLCQSRTFFLTFPSLSCRILVVFFHLLFSSRRYSFFFPLPSFSSLLLFSPFLHFLFSLGTAVGSMDWLLRPACLPIVLLSLGKAYLISSMVSFSALSARKAGRPVRSDPSGCLLMDACSRFIAVGHSLLVGRPICSLIFLMIAHSFFTGCFPLGSLLLHFQLPFFSSLRTPVLVLLLYWAALPLGCASLLFPPFLLFHFRLIHLLKVQPAEWWRGETPVSPLACLFFVHEVPRRFCGPQLPSLWGLLNIGGAHIDHLRFAINSRKAVPGDSRDTSRWLGPTICFFWH